MLVSYVRNKKREKIGVVVAIYRDQVGWSLCRTKLDRFDKDLGLRIAYGRAITGSATKPPTTVMKTYNDMMDRSKAYYKF